VEVWWVGYVGMKSEAKKGKRPGLYSATPTMIFEKRRENVVPGCALDEGGVQGL
jgi:hypothetical protein